ncbi:MAG: inositol monophosphatase family protein [Acidobacteriota bacterium]
MPVEIMQQAAEKAGRLLLKRQPHLASVPIESKGLHDFVTSVDRESEEMIASYLEEHWPGVPCLAEESEARKTGAAERWIIDPLDGTTNYLHGYPCFSVSIAFQSGGRIQAGVVHDPVHGETYRARAGGGASLDGRPLQVSSVSSLDEALLVTGFPFRELDRLDAYLAGFRRLLQLAAGIRRDGSAALDLCHVGAGRCDGFWETGLSPWDVAAGGLVVQEAGGVVSDDEGGGDWLEGQRIVAATPGLHQAILDALRESR